MQNNSFTLLALGDVVGDAGTEAVCRRMISLKKEYGADFVIVNAENSAETYGMSREVANALLDAGADVLTGGNHSLKNDDVFDLLDENERVLRPMNLPDAAPGHGWCIVDAPHGLRVLVISALGQVFMNQCDNPFTACDRLLAEQAGRYDIAVCDIHAEATSEKAAFAEYFDGRINITFGTHTHVQTADRRIFPRGSGFVTDIGMCGVTESVLGVKSQGIIRQFVTSVAERHEKAHGTATLHGAVFTVSLPGKKVTDIKRIETN